MYSILRSFTYASLALVMAAGAAHAQSSASRASYGSPAGVALQSRGGSPSLTLYGGLATGDNAFSMGPALAASFNWNISDAPFNLRLDPYFAYHSTEDDQPDGSLWFLGLSGNLELAFRASGTSAVPYIFGGGGFYMRNISIDTGPDEFDDSELVGGFGVGGGVRFGGFTLEAKLQDIDEFTNVALLVGFLLGGR